MSFNTLSGRFLGLTILFVVIAEVLIFVPSVSRFRQDYLQNRLELASSPRWRCSPPPTRRWRPTSSASCSRPPRC